MRVLVVSIYTHSDEASTEGEEEMALTIWPDQGGRTREAFKAYTVLGDIGSLDYKEGETTLRAILRPNERSLKIND